MKGGLQENYSRPGPQIVCEAGLSHADNDLKAELPWLAKRLGKYWFGKALIYRREVSIGS
jgi:hypothetical protein